MAAPHADSTVDQLSGICNFAVSTTVLSAAALVQVWQVLLIRFAVLLTKVRNGVGRRWR